MDGLNARTADTAWLPAEAPLAMPVQDLASAPTTAPPPPASDAGMAWRRALVLCGTLALTALGTAGMWQVLGLARWTFVGLLMAGLFAVLTLWIALAFVSACAGFASLCLAYARGVPSLRSVATATRTALLMPLFNEGVPAVEAALAAMRHALADSGAGARFDVWMLSDSTEATHRTAERDAVRRLRASPGPEVFYRHRTANEGRKAGNIAEWVRRFGAAYDTFLILDADSVMEAETLLALVAQMEGEPRLGLLQTLPLLHGGTTLFARTQQFAGQVYGPLIAAGIAWWHGAESNYWGHNALIRTRAFADTAGLPRLPGRKPFGGDILSHDFVEAALLRRAGWGVRLLPLLGGSYERGPETLPDMAVRDRRWCQGNLQHAGVVGAAGLHPLSRLHLVSGIAAYASAPLWLGFLLLGIAVSLQARFLKPDYFPNARSLFPHWPVVDAERAIWVLGGTLLLLLAPKILATVAHAFSPQRPRGLLAWLALGPSLVLEILLSGLLSPVTMLTQTAQIWQVLRGADGGWMTQRRDSRGISMPEAWRLGWRHSLLGLLLLVLALSVAPMLAAWMAPVILGLLLAPALISLTASIAAGQRLRRLGLLAAPSETAPSALLRAADG